MKKLANISQFESLGNDVFCTVRNIHEAPEEEPDSIISEVFDRYKDSLQRYENLSALFDRVQNLGISGWNASLPIVERIGSVLSSIEEDITMMKERLLRVCEETRDWTRGRDGFLMGDDLDDYLAGNRQNWLDDTTPENLNNIKELVAWAKNGKNS